jgi:hypothetical protein
MWTILRNRLIGLGFGVLIRAVRLKRLLRQLGKPRIGALEHVTITVRDLDVARRFFCDVLIPIRPPVMTAVAWSQGARS